MTETSKQNDFTHQIDITFYIDAVKGQVTLNTGFAPSNSQHFDHILKMIKNAVGANKEVVITNLGVKPLGLKNQEIDLDELLRLRKP